MTPAAEAFKAALSSRKVRAATGEVGMDSATLGLFTSRTEHLTPPEAMTVMALYGAACISAAMREFDMSLADMLGLIGTMQSFEALPVETLQGGLSEMG